MITSVNINLIKQQQQVLIFKNYYYNILNTGAHTKQFLSIISLRISLVDILTFLAIKIGISIIYDLFK